MAQDPTQIGTLAAERLFARLDGDRSPAETIVVPGTADRPGLGRDPPSHADPAIDGWARRLREQSAHRAQSVDHEPLGLGNG